MIANRPTPPDLPPLGAFVPAPELDDWARASFIEEGAPLLNYRHEHLREASIGWLWTNYEAKSKGREVLGECRLVSSLQAKWSSGMAHYQLCQWFGQEPDFVITISADAALHMDDWAFCALVEHELCHAGQAVDAMGEPRFNQDGNPIFSIIGHDVEQFVDVVERYGATATGVADMVRVANRGATVGQADIDIICGTCSVRRLRA